MLTSKRLRMILGILILLICVALTVAAMLQAGAARQGAPPPTVTLTRTPTPTATPGRTATTQVALPQLEKGQPGVGVAEAPTGTPTPTSTLATVLATATVGPLFSGCANVVQQGDFSGSDKWQLTGGETAWITAESAHEQGSGQLGLFLGRPLQKDGKPFPDKEGWSYAAQAITLPSLITKATLTFWHQDWDDQNPDRQIVELQTPQGDPLPSGRVLDALANGRRWLKFEKDVTTIIRGQPEIRLVLAVYNDGKGGRTFMRIDDVALEVCGATK